MGLIFPGNEFLNTVSYANEKCAALVEVEWKDYSEKSVAILHC